jgi:colanic acid/amylovoran biosynthesis glycosyltransferase
VRIAYLVNQYPQTSHSFIRREVLALERTGHHVDRFTLRASTASLPDPLDQHEQRHTRAVLSAGMIAIVWAMFTTCLSTPGRFLSTLMLTLRDGRRSDRGLVRHFICLGEACVLAKWLRQSGSEHLHSHFGTNSTTVAMLASSLGGVPFSFTVHGPEEFDRAPGLGISEKIARCKFVVAISAFGRGQLMRWSRSSDWNKIHIVRCGLDDLFLAEEPTPVSETARVVCVGRLVEQKAQLILVEAAAILRDRGVAIEVRLVGDGEMRPQIERAIEHFRLHEQVRILGWKSAADVRDEMRACRIVTQPSLAEGLPVAIMEALALARPVVTTQIAGIPELVDAGCGWVVASGDAVALADALQAALECDSSTLTRLGSEGRRRVIERHHIDNEAARLAGLFRGPGGAHA